MKFSKASIGVIMFVQALSTTGAFHSFFSGSRLTSNRVTHHKAFRQGGRMDTRQPDRLLTMYLEQSSDSSSVVERTMKLTTPRNNDKVVLNPDSTSLGTLTVPSVGIGTISWSSDNWMSLESKDLQSLVDNACKSNGAFFDTAERYGSHYKTALGMGWGETERMIQKTLSKNAAANSNTELLAPVVATKFTPTPWRTDVQSVVDACEQSIERLGVDQIDLYQLHMPDIVQPFKKMFGMKGEPKDEIYWDGLAECYHRGLVKNVGVCNYGPTLLMRCQEALAKRGVPLASNQIAYSLIGRHNGSQETLDKCNELGIKVLAFFPFAMGLLTGKYYSSKPDIQFAKNVALSSLSTSKKTKLEEVDLQRYITGDGIDVPIGGVTPLLAVMETIAAQREKTVAQVALNYIICKGAIPIPGARTNDQVMDNIGAMGWRLSDMEVQLLEETADNLGIGFEGAGFKRTSEKFVGYGVEKWNLD